MTPFDFLIIARYYYYYYFTASSCGRVKKKIKKYITTVRIQLVHGRYQYNMMAIS